MKIKTIEINNYKAFYGKHPIPIGGKNLFIYGENGSGKSSLFYAIKDFFQSSMEDIDLNEVENIFIPDTEKGNCSIKITFNLENDDKEKEKEVVFQLTPQYKDTDSQTDLSVGQANALKSFLTYKNLLNIYHLNKNQDIDLFNLLVKGVLKHFKSSPGDKDLGVLWQDVETRIATVTSRKYNITKKKQDADTALIAFNDMFSELFKETGIDSILKRTQDILDQFDKNIKIKLIYTQARADEEYQKILDNHVRIELKYAGKKIIHPHMFLNEARLSAIAISIYLGMIKRHPQLIPYKILFLDDIFIGLDISNRLPLLEILKTEFPEYQVFLTTYDKPWYELAKSYLKDEKSWKTMEFYSMVTIDGYEIPHIFDSQGFLEKAEEHKNKFDYKAAAVYTRSEFEKVLREYCLKKKVPIPFKEKMKEYKCDDFWKVVSSHISKPLKIEIEQYRKLVLNPYSHYDNEIHEIKTELIGAIAAVKKLRDELATLISKKI